MNPEQRLLVIVKYLAVKVLVLVIGALIWMFHPKWVRIANRNRTFIDLCLFFTRADLDHLFLAIFIFAFFRLRFLYNRLYNNIIFTNIGCIDRFIFLLCVCFRKEDLNRHKGTIFVQNLSDTILIRKL